MCDREVFQRLIYLQTSPAPSDAVERMKCMMRDMLPYISPKRAEIIISRDLWTSLQSRGVGQCRTDFNLSAITCNP